MEGRMDIHTIKICDGVYVQVYNVETDGNMVMEHDAKEPRFLRIDYCWAGRMEGEFSGQRYSHLSVGEYALNDARFRMLRSSFPQRIYQGLGIVLEYEFIDRRYRQSLELLGIDLEKLSEAYELHRRWLVQKARGRFEQLFEEVFKETSEETKGYLWIKLMELLYLISTLPDLSYPEFAHYEGSFIDTVKETVKEMLAMDPQQLCISRELKRANINRSYFYEVFKKIYDDTPANYIKKHHLNLAARRLKETELAINKLAMDAGYGNAGNFSAAFKRIYGESPSSYRKRHRIEEFRKLQKRK